jgi:uncharacterized membrane protein
MVFLLLSRCLEETGKRSAFTCTVDFLTPVTGGVYRISRNPQVFSIWIIFLGICIVIGSGLSLITMGFSLVFLHRSVLAEERA